MTESPHDWKPTQGLSFCLVNYIFQVPIQCHFLRDLFLTPLSGPAPSGPHLQNYRDENFVYRLPLLFDCQSQQGRPAATALSLDSVPGTMTQGRFRLFFPVPLSNCLHPPATHSLLQLSHQLLVLPIEVAITGSAE